MKSWEHVSLLKCIDTGYCTARWRTLLPVYGSMTLRRLYTSANSCPSHLLRFITSSNYTLPIFVFRT